MYNYYSNHIPPTNGYFPFLSNWPTKVLIFKIQRTLVIIGTFETIQKSLLLDKLVYYYTNFYHKL